MTDVSPTRKRSILIVEDDGEAARLFHRMLTNAGYGVRAASDADHALEELRREPPSAVLIDWHLQGLDGLDLLRELRAMPRFRDLPAAVITGDYLMDESIAREFTALGARLYFKPLWEEDLLLAVADLVPPG